jgi:hypothetical protein
MDLDVNFYWTMTDTVSAFISAGGAVLVMSAEKIYRRLRVAADR